MPTTNYPRQLRTNPVIREIVDILNVEVYFDQACSQYVFPLGSVELPGIDYEDASYTY